MKTNHINIYILLFLLFTVGLTQSCTDGFEDLNKDPKNPTEGGIPNLFNGILNTLTLRGQEIVAIHNGVYYFQTQQLANAIPAYAMTNGANDIWNEYYTTLKNIRLLYEKLAEVEGLKINNAKACLDIIFAYKTMHLTDYIGDMPFFDAGKGGEGTQYFLVAYDKQEDIYKYCMDLLMNASLAFSSGSDEYSYGSGDTFYKGNYTLWKKFANSLLLRYALQLADADVAYATIVGEILGDPGKYPMFTGTENAAVWPKSLGWITDVHAWSYRENNISCLGTAMWREMSENDNEDGSGIYDPRCYVFFETNNDDKWKATPQNDEVAIPQGIGPYKNGNYPDGRGKAATLQEWENKTAACVYSPVNYYLVSNEDFVPEIMFTAAEAYFLTAEAYNRGIGVTKNAAKANEAYVAGIQSSFDFWYDKVVDPCAQWLIRKPVLTPTQVTDYLTKEKYSDDEATALKQIYKQMWIDSFRQPWVTFNLYRRTLATPRDESGAYNAGDYNFYKVPYAESERDYNRENFYAATDGGNNTTDKKMFWHK